MDLLQSSDLQPSTQTMNSGPAFIYPYDDDEGQDSLHAQIVCQSMNKKFNKTPQGKILQDDLKNIFALLLLNLDLHDSHTSKYGLTKHHGFCFKVAAAIEVLKDLKLDSESSDSSISISYKLSDDVSELCLKKFFVAKLLHYPSDRTRSVFCDSIALQPTPKGVAILDKFIQKTGLKFDKIPSILVSNLNSMDLFVFERNFLHDKICYSDNLIKILFANILGSLPNIWLPNSKPQAFEVKPNLNMLKFDSPELDNPVLKIRYDSSPLHHKYFTNPESDAHIHYFDSTCGIRVFRKKKFYTSDLSCHQTDYRVSGKSVVQWLMDCTDILSIKMALEIGKLLVKFGLLIPILDYPSFAIEGKFKDSFDLYYDIPKTSRIHLFWYQRNQNKLTIHPRNSDVMVKGFNTVLREPGLKYLFRTHLENEYCFENMEAFDQLKLFVKKINLLLKLLNHIQLNYDKSDNKFKSQILRLSNDCLATIYSVYFTYLSPRATHVLNLDYSLIKRMTTILINNKRALDDMYKFNQDQKVDIKPQVTNVSISSESFSSSSEPPKLVSCVSTQQTSEDQIEPQTPELMDNTSVFSCKVVDKECVGSLESPPTSPRDKEFKEIYKSLINFAPVASELINSLYVMMEIDSFPKFVNSEIFRKYQRVLE